MVFVVLHAAFRKTDDLFLDDEETSGLIPNVAGSASAGSSSS